jgi:hypothetical protein
MRIFLTKSSEVAVTPSIPDAVEEAAAGRVEEELTEVSQLVHGCNQSGINKLIYRLTGVNVLMIEVYFRCKNGEKMAILTHNTYYYYPYGRSWSYYCC